MSQLITSPIPHLIRDGLFPERDLAEIDCTWPGPPWDGWYHMKSWREDKWASKTGALFPPAIRDFLRFLNSSAFARYLEETTGIPGLIPDPHFHGGGLHRILPGGFLKMHRDFNWHAELKLVRRVNVLIYLNREWKPEWGGALELWHGQEKASILPEWGRMVILDTQAKGAHGHPDPLTAPLGVERHSIAAYYYTAGKVDVERSTEYHERVPGEFQRTARDRIEALAKDWLPPKLLRLRRAMKAGMLAAVLLAALLVGARPATACEEPQDPEEPDTALAATAAPNAPGAPAN